MSGENCFPCEEVSPGIEIAKSAKEKVAAACLSSCREQVSITRLASFRVKVVSLDVVVVMGISKTIYSNSRRKG